MASNMFKQFICVMECRYLGCSALDISTIIIITTTTTIITVIIITIIIGIIIITIPIIGESRFYARSNLAVPYAS